MDETRFSNRLAAILAADAAGYSRLMAADAHATLAALDAARAVFRSQTEAHRGRVVDTAGDSVLAVFETAAGAVAAALAIQASINPQADAAPEERRMHFRIGVHLGDVIEKADGTVYGDGVNIAARLQALAEPGGIAISDAVRGAVRGKVAASFDDLGEQTAKNMAEPVHAFALRAEAAAPATTTQPRLNVAQIDLSLPDKPSIAVLPFVNMSGDPQQEYFTDGITEDIITELSRFHTLFVIARNSSFSYKGQSPDIRRVGKELGVRYVLEGSIRKSAQRIRVTGQLIDALTGNHLWAEKYDRVLEDIFAVQEELTRSIVAAVAPQIGAAESDKVHRRRPESLGAYEHAVSALAKLWAGYLRADVDQRRWWLGRSFSMSCSGPPRERLLPGRRASRPRRERSRLTEATAMPMRPRRACCALPPTSSAPPKTCPMRGAPTS
jgi:adenylate cyclase